MASDTFSSTLTVFEASDFKTSWNRDDFLGCGSSASVRKCKHPTLGDIVVKCFSAYGSEGKIDKVTDEIAREANVLVRMQHKNIVQIHGMTKWSNCIGIAMESVNGGNLEDFLMSDKNEIIPWALRLKLFKEIADGLSYLHYNDRKKVFIHGDLKPQNVLLTPNRTVKIADFGSVSIAMATGVSNMSLEVAPTTQHTPYYTAPEFLKDYAMERTRAMDVYSVAMVEYEIVTRHPIFFGVHPHIILQLIIDMGQKPNERYLDNVETSLEEQPDDLEIFHVLKNVMKKCWSTSPKDRPDIRDVSVVLNNAWDVAKKNNLSLVVKIQEHAQGEEDCNQESNSTKVGLHEFLSPFKEVDEPEHPSDATLLNSNTKSLYQTTLSEPIPLKVNVHSHEHYFKIVLLGGNFVGKTAITKRLSGQRNVDEVLHSAATIGCAYLSKCIEIGGDRLNFGLWDTAGNERYYPLFPMYLKESLGVLVVYDITDRDSFYYSIPLLLPLIKKNVGPYTKVVLLGNKCDAENLRKVSKEEGENLAKRNYMKFFETSAKNNINIDEAFNEIVAEILMERERALVQSRLNSKALSTFQRRNTANCITM